MPKARPRHGRTIPPLAPAEHEGGTVTQADAFFALVKGNLGPGVLAMPFAFSQTGWVLGLPVLLVTVAQGVYTMLTLAECKRALARPGIEGLGDVVQYSLGTLGRRAGDLFVFVVQGGVCCCFIDLVAGYMAEELSFLSRGTVMLLLAPVFGGIALLREVSQLSGLNKLGSLAMVVAVVAGTTAGVRELSALGSKALVSAAMARRPLTDSVMLAASVFFSFEGLGLVLPVEKEMKEPQAFPKVVLLASAFLVVAFLSITFTCGVAFRGRLDSSIITYLAMHTTGMERIIFETSSILVTAAVVVTFPLQLLPASQILSSWLSRLKRATGLGAGAGGKGVPMWALQRLALVVLFIGAATLVHNVALLVSLFGAVGQTGLGLLAPLCHLVLMRRGILPWSRKRATLNISVVAFCVLIMFAGTYMAMSDILASLH